MNPLQHHPIEVVTSQFVRVVELATLRMDLSDGDELLPSGAVVRQCVKLLGLLWSSAGDRLRDALTHDLFITKTAEGALQLELERGGLYTEFVVGDEAIEILARTAGGYQERRGDIAAAVQAAGQLWDD